MWRKLKEKITKVTAFASISTTIKVHPPQLIYYFQSLDEQFVPSGGKGVERLLIGFSEKVPCSPDYLEIV